MDCVEVTMWEMVTLTPCHHEDHCSDGQSQGQSDDQSPGLKIGQSQGMNVGLSQV